VTCKQSQSKHEVSKPYLLKSVGSSWLFTRGNSYCFQRILAIAILSVRPPARPSVRLLVTRVDQSKAVQARITKSSPSTAWKTSFRNRKAFP